MDKPDLLGTIIETMSSLPPVQGFNPTKEDIAAIVRICEQHKLTSNRQEFHIQIEQIVSNVLARSSS